MHRKHRDLWDLKVSVNNGLFQLKFIPPMEDMTLIFYTRSMNFKCDHPPRTQCKDIDQQNLYKSSIMVASMVANTSVDAGNDSGGPEFANTYEFIFSFNNDGVANVVPISRSYFKLIEILQDNDVLMNTTEIRSACLCEGPGGFIQAINDMYRDKTYLYPIHCIILF